MSFLKREKVIVGLIIFLSSTLTLLPYIFIYLMTPIDKIYLGIRINNFPDTNSYLAWIEQAKHSNWLFSSLYSPEGWQKIFFHPVFLILGIMANAMEVSSVVAYHIGRFLAVVGLLVTGYCFISQLFKEKFERIVTLIIFIFAAGIGWMTPNSADITQIESTNFLNIYESLINPISLFLIIWILILFFYNRSLSFFKQILLISLLSNLVIIVHSYDYIIVLVLLGLISIYKTLIEKDYQYLRKYLYIILFSFPALFWQLYVLNTNTALGVWATIQTSVPVVPSFTYYIFGIGLQIVFGAIGFALVLRNKSEKWLPIALWVIALVLVLYNPWLYRFQRKLTIGSFIPITLFTAVGVLWWHEAVSKILGKITGKLLLIVCLIVLSLTNFYVLYQDLEFSSNDESQLYIGENLYTGIKWLDLNTNNDEIILSSYTSGNLIPALVSRTVYHGHYDQTVDANMKFQIVYEMLSSSVGNKDPLKFFVKFEKINYLFVDEEVRSWGDLDITNRPYLKLVYENQDVQIYEIDQTKLD